MTPTDLAALSTAGQARVVALGRARAADAHPESAAWTATHARERSDLPVEAVLDEWLRAGPRALDVALGERGVAALRLEAEGRSTVAGEGAQVRGYDRSGDPEPYVPLFAAPGETRSHDLVE